MRLFFYVLILLFLCNRPVAGICQPYFGVAKNFTQAILSDDTSVFKAIVYKGKGMREVYDRRTESKINIEAYLFIITWSDGDTTEAIINPEFGSISEATAVAEKHAKIAGQLPCCLRSYLRRIVVHNGVYPYGGGGNALLFYAGKTVEHEQKNDLEEIVVHEAAHNLGQQIGKSEEWQALQKSDDRFISGYAKKFPEREDVSESFLAWLILRKYRNRITDAAANIIEKQIPSRLTYFDNRRYNIATVCR